MLPHRILFPFSFVVLFLPFFALAQNHAGRDVIMCSSASARLGPDQPCATCCYKWSPEIGLNDPNLPNPIVSGISTSHNYTVTVSFPDGHYETDDVSVNVYDVDLTIYHPEYAMPPNSAVPEALEEVPGAQTWVNLDNDDCDADFDREDHEVIGGDNEFLRLHARFTLSDFQRPGREENKGESGLKVNQDYFAVIETVLGTLPSGVILWKSADKTAGIYEPGTPIALSPSVANPAEYEVNLWAEGTEGHVQQQQVKLGARLLDDRNGGCQDEFVSITVLGIAKIEWIGIENGFTGNGLNNSNMLDADPNNALAVRVFSEAKMPGKNQPTKNKVTLRVTFTTVPASPEALYVRCFDIDDPSTEINYVDPNDGGTDGQVGVYAGGTGMNYTKDDDNRGLALIHGSAVIGSGTAGTKWGLLEGATIQSVPEPGIYLKSNITASSIDLGFYASSNCGDNYRVAVHQDLNFIQSTRNRDIFDHAAIVNTCTGTPTGPCTEINTVLESPILTVWRTLHVEYDLMKNPDWQDNKSYGGYFANFIGSSATSAQGIMSITPSGFSPMDSFFISAQPLNDGSHKFGRFQNGVLDIGQPKKRLVNSAPNYGLNNMLPIGLFISKTSNDAVIFSMPCDLTFGGSLPIFCQNGASSYNGFISDITRNALEHQIKINPPLINPLSFTGGTVSIAGGNACSPITIIDSVTILLGNNSLPNSSLKIPFFLRDDDEILSDSLPSNLITRINFSLVDTAFNNTYVDVKVDGAGNIANNQDDLVFSRNLKTDGSAFSGIYGPSTYISDTLQLPSGGTLLNTNYNRQSKTGNDFFWTTYLISGWQDKTKEDRDPYEEPGTRAVTFAHNHDCLLAQGGDNTIIFHETCRDIESVTQGISINATLAHELGHCFGLSHGEIATGVPNPCLGINNIADLKIMHKDQPYSSFHFMDYHINIIRSRISSPRTF